MKRRPAPRSVIVISDTHCGCRMGLFPDRPVMLDGGIEASPSLLQRKVWALWLEFWNEWVPEATKGEPYIVVMNGDAIDGVHHGSKTQVSQNFADQQAIAVECLSPVVEKAHTYYHIRGTEAHVGPSGEQEELLARQLGAKPDSEGHAARWELYLDLHGHLCHFTHHIGTTGSSAYESTAPYKEQVESYLDAGRWDRKPPQVIARSHRHRHIEVRSPSRDGHSVVLVTPGWQLKTPFVYRMPGARASQPQIGGCLIRVGDHQLYTDSRVWSLEPPQTESFND
jgi:hypothetical protein